MVEVLMSPRAMPVPWGDFQTPCAGEDVSEGILCWRMKACVLWRTSKSQSDCGQHKECPSRTSLGHVGLTSSVTALFPETCKHSPRGTESAGFSTESRSRGDSFHQVSGS